MASGTEFLLEIQQKMTGDNVVSELQASQKAVDDAVAKFKDLEKAAKTAGIAHERVGGQIAELRTGMQAAMSAGDPQAFWRMVPALEKLVSKEKELADKAKAAAAALGAQENAVRELAHEFDRVKTAQDAAGRSQGKMDVQGYASGLKKLPGPLRGVGDAVEDFSESWESLVGSVGAKGAIFTVAAAGAAALTAALVAGAVAATAYAVVQADAKRNLGLTLEAMFESADAGAAMQQAFADIGRSTGQSSDRLLELTRSLKEAGIAAADMPDALRGISVQEVALGDTGGTQKLIEDLKAGKVAAGAMADEMEDRFGGTVDAKMVSLDSLGKRLKTNLSSLFDDLDIESILHGLDKLVSFFDSSTESGKALRALIGTLFGPLEDSEGIFTMIEGFMLDMTIDALKVAIAVKKIDKAINGVLPEELGAEFSTMGALGSAALFAIEAAFWPIETILDMLMGTLTALSFAWDGVSSGASAAASLITDAWNEVTSFFDGVDLMQVGTDIINGLADGISAGADAVIAAITGVVGDAVARAKSLLGIASPSKVFAEFGGFTSEGFAEGVDADAPMAERALTDLVSAPNVEDIDAPQVRGSGGSGSSGSEVSGNTFNFFGVEGAEDAERRFELVMRRIVQGAAIELGASLDPMGTAT